MTIKKLIGQVHLWLGLASGIVVFIVGITGCLYVFRDEYYKIIDEDAVARVDHNNGKPYLPPSRLRAIAAQHVPPDRAPNSIKYETGWASWMPFWGDEESFQLYLDPFTGKLLKKKHWKKGDPETFNFFAWALRGHRALWLPWDYGRPVVGYSILIFVIELITGLVLWWPKNLNQTNRDKSFKIKWKGTFKRVNYDLHNVFGFYFLLVALVLALTGLVYSFQWVSKTLYRTASGGKPSPGWIEVPPSDTTRAGTPELSAEDRLWKRFWLDPTERGSVFIAFPQKNTDTYFVNVNRHPDKLYRQEIYYFDRYTLEEKQGGGAFSRTRYTDASFADKGDRMNYDIHVGQIWGLPTKILAFFGSLITASLPVTGFLIWWGRRKKGKKKTPSPRETTGKINLSGEAAPKAPAAPRPVRKGASAYVPKPVIRKQ